MFLGTALVKLDAKGRLSLPARHLESLRRETGDRVVLTRHPDGCLVLYTMKRWEEKLEVLVGLPHASRGFVRMVLGSAEEVAIDAAGRILIPQSLRELTGIGREAALVGLGGYFEIWDRERLAGREAAEAEAGFDTAGFSF